MTDNHEVNNHSSLTLDDLLEELRQSDRRFKHLVEAVPSVVVMANDSGEITYANQRVFDVFGYAPEELIGKPVETLLPENLRNLHFQHRTDYFKRPAIRPMGKGLDLSGRHRDGSTFPVEIGLGYLLDDTENEAIAFIVDITERKLIEEALRASDKSLKYAQAMAHLGSWELDLETDATYWSDEFFRICGFEPGSVEPSTTLRLSLIHPDDRNNAIHALTRSREFGEPYAIEKRIIRPDGDLRWVISQGKVVTDEATNHKKLVGTFLDITDRKLAQQRDFELALERERMRLLTSFIENVAHEFRTPLSVISSSSHLMSRSDDPENRASKAGMINQQVKRTAHLVDMLLLMVKLESIGTLARAPVNVRQMIDEICQHMVDTYGTEPELCLDIPANLPSVSGDAEYLFDAFKQVLDNAFRFTLPDGTITVRAGTEGDQVRVEVQDTGTGIANEHLPHIFTTFWRQDKAHTTPGFGLGLSIAEKIVAMHQGTIQVESTLGEGSTFRILLPR